ncbi:MAG TPA: macrolide ABC transporter ATP-binding protein [Clostridiaceae bacterium]|jgi:putative ABC transport system ATP-binding protein|nr:macrolide ABC transporter ATP-binding protein [Clostridiaceae bacterium]HBF78137.1 macrolide ABC transporter ATP-binding protein [Clostridiaceae bacterium]HBG39333.1 macrolide ABC transporter ATP-binding protein [Clostridiaceae bacterium]
MDNVIDIRNLRKVYRMGEEKVVALDNINLQIKKGEICCLLGTSGSGKSTLLNMMAGLEKPTKGEIIINGYHIERMNEEQITKFRQKHVGFVFQSYNLMNALTALENVALPLEFGGVKKEIRNKRAFEMLKAVGLGDRIKHKPTEMSGGQQQRVSIARAFIGNPEIVFADEPTGNLDTKTTFEIMDLMVNMARGNNQTLIVVTHDIEISSYADKIIYIRDGKIEKEKSKYSGNEGGCK